MKVLELFAGSRSVGKIAEKLGMEVFSSDLIDFDGINYAVSILDFDYKKVPFKPDVIWASPPCTGFSVAAIGHHWTGGKGAYIPNTDTARLGIELVKKTLEIIDHYKPQHWFMENPRGLLRKMDLVQVTILILSNCQYPFMAAPLMKVVHGVSSETYLHLLQSHREHAVNMVLGYLFPNDNSIPS